MSTFQKRKPSFIIYRSPRHSKNNKNNIKYRFFSNKVESSSWEKPLKKCFVFKKRISEITYDLSRDTLKNSKFLQVLARNRSIQTLTLNFYYHQEQQTTGKVLLSKQINKIFLLCSKVEKLNIIISDENWRSYFIFPFQALKLARSLKHFIFNPKILYIDQFRNLCNYLVYANRKNVKHTTLIHLYSNEYFDQDQDQDQDQEHNRVHFSDVQKIFEKIKDMNQNLFLQVSYSKASNVEEDTSSEDDETFSDQTSSEEEDTPYRTPFSDEMTLPLENLVELNIDPLFLASYRKFFEKIRENSSLKKLKKLAFKLVALGNSSRRFSLLIPESLTTLDITFNNFEESESLNRFLGGLKECQNISSLSLKFEDCTCLEAPLLLSLSQSLKELQQLKNLTFSTTPGEDGGTAKPINLEMKNFFTVIRTLKSLRSLNIKLKDGQIVSSEEFLYLCSSLKMLTKLQILKLSFPDSNIKDIGIDELSKRIPACQELQVLKLNLGTQTKKLLSEKSNNSLFGALATLKHLSSLDLTLDFNRISSSFLKSLTEHLLRMKSLNNLSLLWPYRHLDPNVSEDLKFIKNLSKKFPTKVSLHSK